MKLSHISTSAAEHLIIIMTMNMQMPSARRNMGFFEATSSVNLI